MNTKGIIMFQFLWEKVPGLMAQHMGDFINAPVAEWDQIPATKLENLVENLELKERRLS